MSSGRRVATWRSLPPLGRMTPWAVAAFIGAILMSVLPSAQAQNGTSAAEAFPVGADGRFAGTVGPTSSVWFKFNYVGGNQTATVSVTFQPPDSNRLDVFLLSGDPSNPTQLTSGGALNNNVRSTSYTDAGSARVVFIRVQNDHPDRSVSFVGDVTPSTAIATPTPTQAGSTQTPQATPTAGPVAENAANAITIPPDSGNVGRFSGTIASQRAVWYRFYYNNVGADAVVSVSVAPNADNFDLKLYTGTDITNLGPTEQGGSPTRNNNTLSRRINLSNPQFVYFNVANNNSDRVVAYAGTVTPAFAPPATPTPTSAATSTMTATTTATATPTRTPTPIATAPPLVRDSQYFAATGFRIDDSVMPFFQSRGAVNTFGLPISRVFSFLGCPVQMFQRLIVQLCPGAGTAIINMLDPEIFPYTRINQSVFPAPDEQLKNSTPQVGTPEYANILDFVRANTPDTFNGQPVNFQQTFFALGGLEILGTPISHPAADPTNSNFIYQRFQRVILHYRAGIGTEPLLLADYQKQIMLGPGAPNLPPDLQAQAVGSRFFAQYCRGNPLWLCRVNELGGTDLTFAFEQG